MEIDIYRVTYLSLTYFPIILFYRSKTHNFVLFSAQSESSTIQESSEDASSYEYNYDYDGEEQDASDDNQREGEEVERASFNPQFTTEAQHFKVPAQHTIRLPCRVDRLGIKHF